MSISKLKEILDQIDYPVLMEIIDTCWNLDHFEIHWNTDDDEDDLENGDGNTYSVELFEATEEYDGYLVANGNNGCGQTITYFFNLSKEVKF